jgi:DNA-binding transcriptional ArsR family regulator
MPHQADTIATVFGALSDPTRLAIVERLLRDGEHTVGDLADPFDISMPAISKHISVLERAGIIDRRVNRQWRVCRINPQALRDVDDWMDTYRAFWEQSLSRLARLMDEKRQRESDDEK